MSLYDNKMDNKIKVVELFAGVGGFRLGLEGWQNKSASSGYNEDLNSQYKVIWSNQWEPATKTQHASVVYENRWSKDGHSNQDIALVDTKNIPDHDLLVGGFPCQDYSVATTLRNSKGLVGKKGVLWWSIHKILSEKKNKPKYLLLENVDRLLKSPATQRGRDFAIILQSLNELGYAVEWRVINAAEYGMPQRRRRVFILGYYKGTPLHTRLLHITPEKWILDDGTLADAFPVKHVSDKYSTQFTLPDDIVEISDNFNANKKDSPFENSGIMINGNITSIKTEPNFIGEIATLRSVLQDENEIPAEFYLNGTLDKWKELKGSKNLIKKNKDGIEYKYSEGAMAFPDPLDKPSRTIITGEGGPSPSRFKHVVQDNRGLRRLTPIELERLDMFPDDHTKLKGISDGKRAFFMGNALVVGVIEKIGISLSNKM